MKKWAEHIVGRAIIAFRTLNFQSRRNISLANMVIFQYQLRHISRGKYKLERYLDSAKPTLAEYLELVQKIKNAVKERKALLAEKKEISFWNIPKAKELNAKIAELTEDIEELKSEKAVLLNQLDCADDAGIAAIKKDIAYAEAGFFKLEQQEEKYSSKLKAALSEYAENRTFQRELEQKKQQKHKTTQKQKHRHSEQEQ
ncbi:hypothetical protein [Holdemanella biformis]|uniref:hypothetical protein n=1 Tax=Holdemanella biformis TaxID=1735 RepID=UPI0026DAE8C4|nr:hypothetical protein [Holdemanella biformis]